MAGKIQVQVHQLNRTPVFRVTYETWGIDFASIFGATKLPGDVSSWYYPAYYPVYKLVRDDLEAVSRHHHVGLSYSEETEKHLEALDQYDDHIAKARLPADFEFKTKPYKHQLEGLVHLIYSLRAALFYSCGLGKTKIIIDWQRATKCWPIIICPRIALSVWTDELKVHGIDQEYRPVDGSTVKAKREQILAAKDYHGMVVTYDTLRRHYEFIAEHVPFTAIVADESQKIKQSRSQRTKVALEMSKGAYRRVIMSGTPSLGDPRDIYPQYRFLAPYFMPWNIHHFKNLFCTTSPYNKRIVTGFKNLDVLNRRINLVSIRRKKDECLDLPERTIQDIVVPFEPKQKKAYNDLAKANKLGRDSDLATLVNALVNTAVAMGTAKPGDAVINVPHAAALINKLIQISCGFVLKQEVPEKDPCDSCEHLRTCVNAVPPVRPWTPRCLQSVEDLGPAPQTFPERYDCAKATALADLFDDLLVEPAHKVIVWGQYIEEMNIIEDTVAAAGVEYVRVDGSNTGRAQEFAAKFNEDPKCRVYIGQVATGVAITLNSAQYMVYFSLPWNMEHYAQSIDRNHRLGQSKNVTVYRLLSPGVDQHIAKALSVKRLVADALVDDGEVTQRKVSRPITKVHEI